MRLESAEQVIVKVTDESTGMLVPNATVRIKNYTSNGRQAIVSEYPANAPFTITFHQQRRVFDPETRKYDNGEMPSGTVIAPSYLDVDVDFGFNK